MKRDHFADKLRASILSGVIHRDARFCAARLAAARLEAFCVMADFAISARLCSYCPDRFVINARLFSDGAIRLRGVAHQFAEHQGAALRGGQMAPVHVE